ncbi:lysozyme-like domain-containing protein [Rhizobium sp. TAL182]|uniref:lysozyme n=1 Tax=Rhizobium sp. TAL182 TaxID=2020313 RepID=UPI000A210B69|nr:lysozyme [Rhizobium sp. TAL182]ARO24732.1 lysozyme-like domain-containing protein [Rhizobium sp. TAL182]
MPINKIVSTKRGKAAIAAALIAAAAGGWQSAKDTSPTVHPPAVILAKKALIETWEGVVLTSHWDPFAKIYDICYGKTRINGKPVKAGLSFSPAECEAMLEDDLFAEYYQPLVKKVPAYTSFPVSVQASQLSGAYNFGVGGMVNSTAMELARQGRFREACEAQTKWNRAGGQVVNGLVKRREMGDAQRIGEAELCVSGL